MVPERLACIDIGEVNFDKGNPARCQGVAQGDAAMGKGSRVQKDKGDFFFYGLMYPLHQRMFGIALKKMNAVAGGFGYLREPMVDLLQAGSAVIVGFPASQQI